MPAGKRQQSNAVLYTLITFVGLFILTTTVAIIFYVKSEDYRIKADSSQSKLEEMATSAEQRKIGAIVGEKKRRKSTLGTMVDYFDEVVTLIIGSPLEDTSVEVKAATAKRKTKEALELLAEENIGIEASDINSTAIVQIIKELKTNLVDVTNVQLATQKQLKELQTRFDDAMTTASEKEQVLLEEKEKYQQQVNNIKQDYTNLKTRLRQSTDQTVQNLVTQWEEEKANRKKTHQNLLKTQAELKIAHDRIKHTQKELQMIVPAPDSEVAAFKPDGKILLIDHRTKIVHLNIGSNDGVWQGLTFSVYEKSLPIPKNGKGKAEIEVFNIAENVSAARIIRSEIKNPIVQEDVIANLIWDADKTNMFVVAGDFDLDSNGKTDFDAAEKIKALIGKWRGVATDTVSVDTDFIVLGKAPRARRKPTFEAMEIDPLAMQKYEASLKKLDNYKKVQNRAGTLSIPVFNYERFLYFIGYKTQSNRAGAF